MRAHVVCALGFLVAAPAVADKKAKPADETIDTIMDKATAPPSSDDPGAKPKAQEPAKPDKVATAPAEKAPPQKGKPAPIEAAPITDDNDGTAEAARPKAFQPGAAATAPRRPGPYEMGPLDCRILDGAGIERILPTKMIAGEEPDLLCRILVTQPATVSPQSHTLTLSVFLGSEEKYRQQRTVRMSSVGRRAMVFVVPADRISTEEAAKVTMRATLSAPAKPPTREIKFVVEPAD